MTALDVLRIAMSTVSTAARVSEQLRRPCGPMSGIHVAEDLQLGEPCRLAVEGTTGSS